MEDFSKKNWRALLCFSQRELPPISLFVLRLSRAGPRGRNHPFKIPCGQAQLESHADSDSPAWRCLKRVSERNHAPWPATARQAGRKPNARPQRVTWEARCALLHLMGARPEAALLAPRPPLRQGTARAFFPPCRISTLDGLRTSRLGPLHSHLHVPARWKDQPL